MSYLPTKDLEEMMRTQIATCRASFSNLLEEWIESRKQEKKARMKEIRNMPHFRDKHDQIKSTDPFSKYRTEFTCTQCGQTAESWNFDKPEITIRKFNEQLLDKLIKETRHRDMPKMNIKSYI